MEYPTKANQTMKAKDSCELKQPYYLELAEKAFDDFIQMNPDHMVEAFKYFQKKLCDTRFEQNINMKRDLESHAKDVESHANGTDVIAAAL